MLLSFLNLAFSIGNNIIRFVVKNFAVIEILFPFILLSSRLFRTVEFFILFLFEPDKCLEIWYEWNDIVYHAIEIFNYIYFNCVMTFVNYNVWLIFHLQRYVLFCMKFIHSKSLWIQITTLAQSNYRIRIGLAWRLMVYHTKSFCNFTTIVGSVNPILALFLNSNKTLFSWIGC